MSETDTQSIIAIHRIAYDGTFILPAQAMVYYYYYYAVVTLRLSFDTYTRLVEWIFIEK